MALLSIHDVFKSYFLHGKRIDVLRGVSLDIEKGELVSLIGASGAGKSTFLHVLGTLDMPAAGELRFEGRNVFAMNDAEIADFRNRVLRRRERFQGLHRRVPRSAAPAGAAGGNLVPRRGRRAQPRTGDGNLARDGRLPRARGRRIREREPGSLARLMAGPPRPPLFSS